MTHPTNTPGETWPTDPAQGNTPGYTTPGYTDEGALATPVEPVSYPTTGSAGAFASDASTGSDQQSSTADAAKQQASEVKDTATSAAQNVAGTAKDQARNVAGEVGQRSREMLSRTGSELSDQAGRQQQRLAEGISGYADELRQLASGNEKPGHVSDLAHELAERGERAADWLSNSEPREVLNAVQGFARRRPVAFLAISAGAGLLVGRFARGLFADSRGGDPMLNSGARHGSDQSSIAGSYRPSASLEELPTSGTGAGPTYGDPLADPAVDPIAAPVYGPATTTPGGTPGQSGSTFGGVGNVVGDDTGNGPRR